jgi:hypothetical protein
LSSDAGALTVAEPLERVDRVPGLGVAAEIFRIEQLGVLPPDQFVAMKHRGEHHEMVMPLQAIFAADHGIGQRRDAVGRRGRPQAQGLLEDLPHIGQLIDLGVGRLDGGVRAEHPVDLRIGLLQHVGIVQQRVRRKRQQAAGGLVSGDQERDGLVADLHVVEPLAGFLPSLGLPLLGSILLGCRLEGK